MYKTYLKTTVRNLQSRKSYTILNMAGLSVGIAASLLIYLVISYELGYDKFQSKKDRIHRLVTTYLHPSDGSVTGHESAVPIPLPDALRTDIPQLEKVAAIWNIGSAQIHIPIPGKDLVDETKLKVSQGLFFCEPGIFTMFDYNWLRGNAQQLNEPNTAVLSESLANSFFGDWKNAMGRTVQLWSFRIPLRIVGVYKDPPRNSDLEIKMGASYATFRSINTNWFAAADWEHVPWNSECFVLLPAGTGSKQFQQPLAGLVSKYFPKEINGQHAKVLLELQPLTNMHLGENFYTFKGDALTQKELWSLGLIGFFILLVACINFINLATAQSVSRAKEVGVRKVLGSSRLQIIKQFLHETAFLTLVAMAAGYLLAQLFLPLVANMTQKPLSLNIFRLPSILIFLCLLGLTVIFLAGFYPGWVLSGFRPVTAIKNKLSSRQTSGVSFRRALVVLQFVIAQLLIIGTIVVIRQMKFFKSQPLGFEKNAIVFIELPSDSLDQTRYPFLKAEMLKVRGVEAASFCLDAPASFGTNNNSFYFDNSALKKDFAVNLQFGDTGYLRTFQINLVAGRLPYPSDTMRELLVNETLVKKLGFRDMNAIVGKNISFNPGIQLPVVGVMHDFHSKSLKEAVSPFVLATDVHGYGFLSLRLDPAQVKSTLEQVQKVFVHTYPTYIYDLSFLDERLEHFYTAEALASKLFSMAAILSIFISCLGLYGLVSFMAAQKTKEVGIRKVLGASVQSIVYLFSREFTMLIGIAFLVASPIGYFLMHEWLNGFYYHIQIGWMVFCLAIFLSVLVAWLTVGYKAISAALANPVKSLRTE